jgi:uncharacterized protein YjdB
MKRRSFASLFALAALALAGCQDAAPERLTAPATAIAANGAPQDAEQPAFLPYVTSVSVNCPAYIYVGQSGSCMATSHYSDGSISYNASVYWSASNPAVMSVAFGSIYGVSAGTAAAWASVDGVSGAASVQVREAPRVTSIVVSPASDAVAIGGTKQFTAAVYDQYGAQFANQPVSWSVDNGAVASVNASGLATGVALGTTSVRASAGGVSGAGQLSVVPSVSLSGPPSAYHQNVTFTATPNPAGTYHYTWLTKRCTVGGTCASQFSTATQGTDMTSFTSFVSKYDANLVVAVQIRAYAGGPLLASATRLVSGAGEYPPNSSCAPRLFC